MKTVIIISLYFLILILIFRTSKKMAHFLTGKGLDLEQIKFVVWFYLNSFIINLTIITGGIIAYQINLISYTTTLFLCLLFFILLILSIVYLFFKLFS